MIDNMKKWRWWVVVLATAPLWIIIIILSIIASVLRGIVYCVDYLGNVRPPLWMKRFVKWGKS